MKKKLLPNYREYGSNFTYQSSYLVQNFNLSHTKRRINPVKYYLASFV